MGKSIYAEFYDSKEMEERLDELLNSLPAKRRFDVVLYVGRLQTTYDIGFRKTNEEESDKTNAS